MILLILRGLFLLLVASVAALYLLSHQAAAGVGFGAFVLTMAVALGLAGVVIVLDVTTRRKRVSALSGVFLGLIGGLVAAYALSFVVDLIGVLTAPEVEVVQPQQSIDEIQQIAGEEQRRALLEQWQAYEEQAEARQGYLDLLEGVKVLIGLITCYVGISLVLQTKDDFRFVIPYVEFAREVRGNRPTVLDTSVIIDGRILEIIETGVLQGTVVIPRFVLQELQNLADSPDKLKRARGRRGLDILRKLQEAHRVDVRIDEAETEEGTVDERLIAVADRLQGRVMSNDYNLNKVASVQGVDVINLNDLAKALRPVALPGEHMSVRLMKPGESPNQGVGYLEDGTMVVVEEGRGHLNERVELEVTSTLQTSAGRMIFGRFLHPAGSESQEGEGEAEATASQEAPPSEQPQPTSGESQAAASGSSPRPSRRGRNPRRSR